MLNFLFSGWLASLIITITFYLLGIRPFIKNLINTDLASKIAESIAGISGGNTSNLQQQSANQQIKAELLKSLFPDAFNYIERYEITNFIKLKNQYNLTCGFTTFCQKDSHAWNKLSKQEKKKLEKKNNSLLK